MTRPSWWRSFEECAEDATSIATFAELPKAPTVLDGVDRRSFLRLMAASAALA